MEGVDTKKITFLHLNIHKEQVMVFDFSQKKKVMVFDNITPTDRHPFFLRHPTISKNDVHHLYRAGLWALVGSPARKLLHSPDELPADPGLPAILKSTRSRGLASTQALPL